MAENTNYFIQKIYVPLNLINIVSEYKKKVEDGGLTSYIDYCIANDNLIRSKLNRGSDFSIKRMRFNRIISDILKEIISSRDPKNIFKIKGQVCTKTITNLGDYKFIKVLSLRKKKTYDPYILLNQFSLESLNGSNLNTLGQSNFNIEDKKHIVKLIGTSILKRA